MPRKPRDTDYLYLSAYLRSREVRLLTAERRNRMLDARSDQDAAKVLTECGYEGLEPLTAQGLEQSLRLFRESAYEDISEAAPDPGILDVFRMKYDYHNVKAILKCAATGQDPARLFIAGGRVTPEALQEALTSGETDDLPEALGAAALAAQAVLEATSDPQKSDFSLDRAYYAELTAAAEATGSDFLRGYVRLLIDGQNLKALVRSLRMKQDQRFLGEVLVPGGSVDTDTLLTAASGENLTGLFPDALEKAAALGEEALRGGSQTGFEREVDDALGAYLGEARMAPFGESVLISYLAAVERDITAARIILSGRMAGVPTESIRERLREAYV